MPSIHYQTLVPLWPMSSSTHNYRKPAHLYVDGRVLFSREGTTQGDPLAMPMYAIATMPLIKKLDSVSDVLQVLYADDASAAGKIAKLRQWWDQISQSRKKYVNGVKTWLVVKEEFFQAAVEAFF